MQHTTDYIQDHHNGRSYGTSAAVEGSTSMTIEYLRVRLHSERSVTKATRDRANELAEQVAELEEQLKIATIQRKKAEKATLDVLALLENHGMVEFSDEYDSDLDESYYEGNLDKGNSVKEKESSLVSKRKEGSSGSEHESTPSTGRSLSWKSSKGSPHSRERKCSDPSPRKHSSFVQSASSRHRLGKSCRQIKRREVSINGMDSRLEEMRKCSENNGEKALRNAQISVSSQVEGQTSDGSVLDQKHTSNVEMERVLQHQEYLIGRYATEEKAQREWEEKCMGNGCSIPDLCEPGNQSDVTEERDEAQAFAPSPTKIVASSSNSHKSNEERICAEKGPSITHVDSSKFSPNPASKPSHILKVNEVHSCRTSASHLVFPIVNDTHILRNNHINSSPSQPQLPLPYSRTAPSVSGDNKYTESETSIPRSKEVAIVPHESPQRLEGILDALQQAKQFLGENLTSPSKEVVIANMGVGSAGLFRVPTDFQFKTSGPQTTVPGSGYPLRLNNQQYHSSVPLAQVDHFFSSMPASSEPRVSSGKSWYGTSMPPSNGFTSFLDMKQKLASSESPFTVQSPSRSFGLPPTGLPFSYNYDHIRPDLYR